MKLDMSKQQNIAAGSAETIDTTPYFFLCPSEIIYLWKKKNKTDLSNSKYGVKRLKGIEELVSNLGPCESQLQIRNNEN